MIYGTGRDKKSEWQIPLPEFWIGNLIDRPEGIVDCDADRSLRQSSSRFEFGENFRDGKHGILGICQFREMPVELFHGDIGLGVTFFAEAVIHQNDGRIRSLRRTLNQRPDEYSQAGYKPATKVAFEAKLRQALDHRPEISALVALATRHYAFIA
mgnify:CR=1 FL=1